MAAPFIRTSVPGIYRRGGRYVVTFTDPTGKRRKRSAATMAEAGVLRAALATDVARGDFRELSDVTFDDYAREWVRTYQGRTGRGIRETTLEEYRKDLEIDPIPYFGRRRLAEIEPRHIKALAKHIADRGVAPGDGAHRDGAGARSLRHGRRGGIDPQQSLRRNQARWPPSAR